MSNSIPYFVKDNLEIEINVIGYRTIGESSVLFIRCDSMIVFSAVIDCYIYQDLNKTIEILKENGVEKLDYLCWTHPDADHSEGMVDLFEKFVTNETIVNIPENSEANQEQCSGRVIKLFEKLCDITKNNRGSHNIYTVSDVKDLLAYCDDISFLYNNLRYSLKMKSIAPNSSVLREKFIHDKFEKNDCSIVFIMEFGKLLFMFTGDVENETLNCMNSKNIPKDLFFLKIPHHGSKSSNALLKNLNSVNIACSTSYKIGKSNLPEDEIIDDYKKICQKLFMTSSQDMKINNENYGIVQISVDILNTSFETRLQGNALEVQCA